MTARILVPLDGSRLAEQALGCAIVLARALPAELVILHAVSIPPDTRQILNSVGLDEATVTEQLKAEATTYLNQIAGELEDAGLSVQPAVGKRTSPSPRLPRLGAWRTRSSSMLTQTAST